jgi:uracil-DNA glycosylase
MITELFPTAWAPVLQDPSVRQVLPNLENFLSQAVVTQTVYPPQSNWFQALTLEPQKVRVVIIGQDPYHGPNQAHGLCFSVKAPTPPPPSLVNIYKELKRSTDFVIPAHGDLSSWAQQGVLMLNTTLTVAAGMPGSHKGQGWEQITDAIIRWIQTQHEQLIFVLWGNHALEKRSVIDATRHIILSSAHPSPFSVRKFAGNNHFVIINQLLTLRGDAPINWAL